jgi:hypothetical protein
VQRRCSAGEGDFSPVTALGEDCLLGDGRSPVREASVPLKQRSGKVPFSEMVVGRPKRRAFPSFSARGRFPSQRRPSAGQTGDLSPVRVLGVDCLLRDGRWPVREASVPLKQRSGKLPFSETAPVRRYHCPREPRKVPICRGVSRRMGRSLCRCLVVVQRRCSAEEGDPFACHSARGRFPSQRGPFSGQTGNSSPDRALVEGILRRDGRSPGKEATFPLFQRSMKVPFSQTASAGQTGDLSPVRALGEAPVLGVGRSPAKEASFPLSQRPEKAPFLASATRCLLTDDAERPTADRRGISPSIMCEARNAASRLPTLYSGK